MNLLLHPTYFPNIASFALILKYEVHWEVWDHYQKQTFRNRCYICTDRGKHMLNIPIKHVGGKQGRQLYRDVQLDNSYPWQRTHWRSLQTSYRASPYFEFFEGDLAPLYDKKHKYLLDFNLKTIEAACECLQIDMPTQKTENYQANPSNLEDRRALVNAKKELPVNYPPYAQVFEARHGFIPGLSILDLLFNEGNSALAYLSALDIEYRDA